MPNRFFLSFLMYYCIFTSERCGALVLVRPCFFLALAVVVVPSAWIVL